MVTLFPVFRSSFCNHKNHDGGWVAASILLISGKIGNHPRKPTSAQLTILIYQLETVYQHFDHLSIVDQTFFLIALFWGQWGGWGQLNCPFIDSTKTFKVPASKLRRILCASIASIALYYIEWAFNRCTLPMLNNVGKCHLLHSLHCENTVFYRLSFLWRLGPLGFTGGDN